MHYVSVFFGCFDANLERSAYYCFSNSSLTLRSDILHFPYTVRFY